MEACNLLRITRYAKKKKKKKKTIIKTNAKIKIRLAINLYLTI